MFHQLPPVQLPCPEGIPFDIQTAPGATVSERFGKEGVYSVESVRIGEDSCRLVIHPLDPLGGIVKIRFPFRMENRDYEGIRLVVMPEPGAGWEVHEPDAGLSHRKSHAVSLSFSDSLVDIDAASRRGRAHAHTAKFREDDFEVRYDAFSGRYALVVSDGGGSYPLSRIGSRIASETIASSLLSGIPDSLLNALPSMSGNPSAMLLPDVPARLADAMASACHSAIPRLEELIAEHNAPSMEKPWSIGDFYSTVLAATVKRRPDGSLWVLSFSIGDGAMAWLREDGVIPLCSPDEGPARGHTQFGTDPAMWPSRQDELDWRAFCERRIRLLAVPPGESGELWMMTDGVSDPFQLSAHGTFPEDNWNKFRQEIATALGPFSDSDKDAKKTQSLLEWLSFYKEQHHDDRTVLRFRKHP